MADLPPCAYGHLLSGTFRPLTGDAAADGVQASGYKSLLFWFRVVLGRRYRSSQITIRTAEAKALSVLFKPGPVTVDIFVMRALGTLIHEEFHAINGAGWQGVIFEMLVRTPALTQFKEGIIDAGVEEFLPELLPELGMAGLKKSLRFSSSGASTSRKNWRAVVCSSTRSSWPSDLRKSCSGRRSRMDRA